MWLTGSTQFYYDNIGRLIFSQNDKQKQVGKYTYTLYDKQNTTGMYQIHIKEQMEAQYVSVCHKQVITICLQVKMLLLDNHRCRK